LREYHAVYEKLELQIRTLRPLFVREGSRIGDANFVTWILRDIPGIADEDKPDKERLMTDALFLACENGHPEVAEVLITGHSQAGAAANVNQENSEFSTPLVVAARHGFADVAKILLKHRAEVNQYDADGKTPLMIASEFGHQYTVKLLLESAVNVNAISSEASAKQTALMLSARHGHTAIVERLLAKRALIDLRDSDDRTALIIASEYGKNKAAQTLLRFGANVNATRADKTTSLHIATSSGNEALVKILLQGGADYTMINGKNKAAASLATSESILQLLLGVQVYDECSREAPEYERIKDLLKQEADIGYQGPDEKTALQIAYDTNNTELKIILENPPLMNGPLSYSDQRSYEELQWPVTHDELGCVVEVHGEIIDFHVQAGKEKRLRARPSPTLQQMIYREKGISADKLLSKGYSRGSEAVFRYYHLPANNVSEIASFSIYRAYSSSLPG
jgi:ankyrin repeat protein